jgi:hypothetical protein
VTVVREGKIEKAKGAQNHSRYRQPNPIRLGYEHAAPRRLAFISDFTN